MRWDHEGRKRVEGVLKDVYLGAGSHRQDSLDPDWKANALRRIRSLPESPGQIPLGWLFQHYLWRLAPVAGVLILFIALWMVQSGLNPDIEMAALALDNPIDFGLIEPFGL
ncbi:hypothetical protein DSCW_26770 [Desulfosarcina widdelii]|uniref:Uncharacterized protein n=1 Tax=Desulfosarcina widdelii TaxID=947919 RepID=A0A5K7Z3L5_9BACT|nr:hypothetical protein [Desulfosarcina widdelii]BBO75260.1 hypothetical protein DSCW_26770 [Desulfosarcina widdelii]